MDQYRNETDPHTGVVSDPNDPADEQFIVRLIERVTTVRVASTAQIKVCRRSLNSWDSALKRKPCSRSNPRWLPRPTYQSPLKSPRKW